MLSFSCEQKKVKVGGITIGGQPGDHPFTLFGTVFYGKKYLQLDRELKEEVISYLHTQTEMVEMTGVNGVVDIFIPSEEVIDERVELVLGEVPKETPISLDVPESQVRIKALTHIGEIGASSRTILNSLNLGVTKEEIGAITENPPAASIVLGYNPSDLSADGRLDILDTGGGYLKKGLVQIAEGSGIEGLLLDTAATIFGNMASESIRSIPVVKNRWGYPTGCAIHNTVESWVWMKGWRKEHRDEYRTCDLGSNALVAAWGGDFSVYGPMRNARTIFPFMAMVDKFLAEGGQDFFGRVPSEGHPHFKLP